MSSLGTHEGCDGSCDWYVGVKGVGLITALGLPMWFKCFILPLTRHEAEEREIFSCTHVAKVCWLCIVRCRLDVVMVFAGDANDWEKGDHSGAGFDLCTSVQYFYCECPLLGVLLDKQTSWQDLPGCGQHYRKQKKKFVQHYFYQVCGLGGNYTCVLVKHQANMVIHNHRVAASMKISSEGTMKFVSTTRKLLDGLMIYHAAGLRAAACA